MANASSPSLRHDMDGDRPTIIGQWVGGLVPVDAAAQVATGLPLVRSAVPPAPPRRSSAAVLPPELPPSIPRRGAAPDTRCDRRRWIDRRRYPKGLYSNVRVVPTDIGRGSDTEQWGVAEPTPAGPGGRDVGAPMRVAGLQTLGLDPPMGFELL